MTIFWRSIKKPLNIVLVLLLLLASSCEMPRFDRYPGERLKEIPLVFQGDWVSYELSIEGSQWEYNDTTEYIITKDSWKAIDDKGSEFLSDSIVLSKYKNYYFLSTLDEGGWKILVLEHMGSGFRLSPIIVNDDKDDKVLLEEYFSKIEIKKDSSGDEYFSIVTKEKEIINYFKKYMLKHYYMRFEFK